MQTAAAMEIEQGSLRRYSLDDFHRCLKKSAQKTLRLFHSYHRPDGGGYDNDINFSKRLRSTLNKPVFGPKNGEPLNLLACDALIGCVDRDWPRLILNEVANQYLIPYIDIGTEIGIAGQAVSSLDVRASYVTPDRPCLLCAGVVSPERIRLEGYSEAELHRVIQMGYSTDFRLHAPAVMDLNMRAASWAMLLLRHVLQPFLCCPLPHSIRESVTNFNTRIRLHIRSEACPLCGNIERLGSGSAFSLTTHGD